MHENILICKSSTAAHKSVKILKRNSISCEVVKTLISIADKTCSYGVKLNETDVLAGLSVLRQNEIIPLVIAKRLSNGSYKKINPVRMR